MSVLDDVFVEERERLLRIQSAMEREISELPKGYISKKRINGKVYSYLQWREGQKMVSSFVPATEVADLQKKIDRRRQLQASLRVCREDLRKLDRVV